MSTIVLTGGGTAGHVTPNMALVPLLKNDGHDIHYIGAYKGVEKELTASLPLTYHGISSGKLRRYFDIKNISDPFKVIWGIFQSFMILSKVKPSVVFSKGGFVSVPVVIAAKLNGIPVVIHESDLTPGLANRISIPMAKVLCTTFEETAKAVGDKAVYTGSPIRPELYEGDRVRGLFLTGLNGEKPIILSMGGSMGAKAINTVLRDGLDALLKDFDIIHLCGKGNLDDTLKHKNGYCQLEYVGGGMADIFAVADVCISRAGANTIWELAALRIPMLLIPLPLSASRGDQIHNAKLFEKNNWAVYLDQESMDRNILIEKVYKTWQNKNVISKHLLGITRKGLVNIYNVISKFA